MLGKQSLPLPGIEIDLNDLHICGNLPRIYGRKVGIFAPVNANILMDLTVKVKEP